MAAGIQLTVDPRDGAIIAKAVTRAAERLDLSGRVLAGILGLSEASVSRLRNGTFPLESDRKAFELAVLFVRLYRSLDAITGGSSAVAASWFKSYNTALDARPIDAVQSIAGLMNVIHYLDARRAPL